LKALEEPPSRTVFLLLAADPGRQLATIRSRCRKLILDPLPREDLWEAAGQAMTAADVEPPLADDRMRLTLLAEGSVRRFLELARSGGLAADVAVERALKLLPRVDWAAVHTLADQVAAAGEDARFQQFCDLLSARLARLVRLAAGGPGDGAETEAARRLIQPGDLATWAELWERIGRDRAETEALNLDRRTFVMTVFARLETAARR
jgi:DNA polymerase-3 subunit delta'